YILLIMRLVTDGAVSRLIVFFFQAEDGIRDKLVTGVQTCALPIFQSTKDEYVPRLEWERLLGTAREPKKQILIDASNHRFTDKRSEERRVGKECSWRRGPGRSTIKQRARARSRTADGTERHERL